MKRFLSFIFLVVLALPAIAQSYPSPTFKNIKHLDSSVIDVVADYGADNTGLTDTTAALNAAITAWNSSCGKLNFPAGKYLFTGPLATITCSGGSIIGAGATLTSGGTTLIENGTSANPSFNISGSISLTISGFAFTDASAFTGYEINLLNCGWCHIKNIDCFYVNGCVAITNSTQVFLSNVTERYISGAFSIFYAANGGAHSNGLNLINVQGDDPAACPGPDANNVTGWAAGKGIIAGQFIDANGWVMCATTGGTTAMSGSGPTPSLFNIHSIFDNGITDGTVVWRAAFRDNLTWIAQESNADSIQAFYVQFIRGATCFSQNDAGNSPQTYPFGAYFSQFICDHPWSDGVALNGGIEFHATQLWEGSSTTGSGIVIGSAYQGEVSIEGGSRVYGNAKYGVISYNASLGGLTISNSWLGENSQLQLNGYQDIFIQPGMSNFIITNNHIGIFAPATTSSENIGINVNTGTSDYYTITGNICKLTTCVADNGTGTHKTVSGNW